jgi:RNA recognition motif-containing protein
VNIFVGNLPYGATEADLRSAFEAHGEVASASIIMDKMTGRSRGFGFVEMPNSDQATAAINALNNADFNGRPLTVNEARPRTDGPRAGGGGGGGGGRGGFGGGRRDRY